MQDLHNLCQELCQKRGVIFLGILAPKKDPEFPYFQKWLRSGKHAQMQYLKNHLHLRENPAKLETRMPRVMVCAVPYPKHKNSHKPEIAAYARLKDYHKVLRRVGEDIIKDVATHLEIKDPLYRCVVDSAPILEKSLASQTKQGFRGKNSLYILPKVGSYVFLFEIYTSLPLPISQQPKSTSASQPTGCGTCRRCQVHCPTGALDSDYELDARRCIAYYTIEHRGTIPVRFWDYLALYYFGCDICQRVCPHNRYAADSSVLKEKISSLPPLTDVALMDEQSYIRMFAGTPATRAKRVGLRRNALIALYVTKSQSFSHVKQKIFEENEPLLVNTLKQIKDYKAYKDTSNHH